MAGFFIFAMIGFLALVVFSFIGDQGQGHFARAKRHVRNDGPIFGSLPGCYWVCVGIITAIVAVVATITVLSA